MKRQRRAARIILLDADSRFLLFRFAYGRGPLAGTEYWGVPGGGVEEGETLAEAAVRELREETGIAVDAVGPERGESGYPFRLSSGEEVRARDAYFVVRLDGPAALSRDGFTPEEAENLAEYRWWSLDELRATGENIVPADLAAVLSGIFDKRG